MQRGGGVLAEAARQLELVSGELALRRRFDEEQRAQPLVAEDERDVKVGELARGLHGVAHGGRHRVVGDTLQHDLAAQQRQPVAGVARDRDGDVLGLDLHRAVRGARHEGGLGLEVFVDGAAGRLEGLGRGLRHDGQGLVEAHRGGQRPAGFEQRLERAVLAVEPLEEVGVADGDGGQRRDLREQLLLGGAEAPARARFDEAQDADDAAVELQGRVERGLFAPAVHLACLGGGKAGVVAVHLDHLAFVHGGQEAGAQVGVERLAGHLLAHLVVRLAHPGGVAAIELEVPEGEVGEEVGFGVVAVDVARVDAEGFADLARDRRHDVADFERRGDRGADLGDDGLAILHVISTSRTCAPLVRPGGRRPCRRPGRPPARSIGAGNTGLEGVIRVVRPPAEVKHGATPVFAKLPGMACRGMR